MADIVRHIGSFAASGTRAIVVFRELPEDEDHCLVLQADSLPEIFRDAVSHVVNHQGQHTKDLYEALHRETMPTGENMLGALHKYGLLTRTKASDILMHPTRNYNIRLDELNEQLRHADAPVVKADESDLQKKFNPYQEKAEQLDDADANNIAVRLLQEADDYKAEAERKIQRALELRPELAESYAAHSIASEAVPVSVTEMPDSEALIVMNELLERFPIAPETVYVEEQKEASATEFTIELHGLSQRKATEAVKEAWRKANPDKVKDK